MRDLEQIEEREPGEGTRKAAMMSLLGLCMVGVTLAVGALMGDASATEAQPLTDPLAALARAQRAATDDSGEGTPQEEPELAPVDREALTFPETLVDEEEPGLAEVLAAADAELSHPDALTEEAPAIARSLPAAVAAASSTPGLMRDATDDPVLAAALPQVAPTRAEPAPVGSPGPYTLQVISYRSEDEAEAFASTLRSRGHAAFVVQGEVEGRGTFYRVRIGPFANRVRAERYRATFEQQEGMNTFVYRQREETRAH